MTQQRGFTCPYCGESKSRAEGSLEHPLPRAIGGRGFARRDFCEPCNQKAGGEVDRPFVEHETMRVMRHRWGVRDARGDVPPAPRMYGNSEDGVRGYLELGQEPVVRRVPRVTRDDDTGATIIAEVGEGAAVAEQHRQRLEQRGRELHGAGGFRLETSIERIEDPGVLSVRTSLKSTVWPRFGAKLGLAFGREVLGDPWVCSEGAARLRRLLSDDPAAPEANPLWDQVEDEDDPFAQLVAPPEHFVAAMPYGDGSMLLIQLFGGLRYAVPLSDDHPVPADWTVWTFNPVAGTARKTTLSQLIGEKQRDVEAG